MSIMLVAATVKLQGKSKNKEIMIIFLYRPPSHFPSLSLKDFYGPVNLIDIF